MAVAFGVAACGDDGETTTSPSTAPPTNDGTTTAREIEVTAVDYTFRGLPNTVDTGTAFALANESTREIHELVAVRLPAEETRSAQELLALPPDQLQALFSARPTTVIVAAPGERGVAAVGDGTIGEAGRYLFVCFIPTGADPSEYLAALEANPGQPPAVAGGPPHFTSGMFAEVTVRPD